MPGEKRDKPSLLSPLVRLKRDWLALFPPARDDSEALRDTRRTRNTFLLLTMLGIAAMAIYALQWKPPGFAKILGDGALLALASVSSGLCLGFLFGIPRTPVTTAEVNAKRYGVNTNLEQISDWLTKIIVGFGLIQLREIPGYVGRLLRRLAPSFGGDSGFVLSIVVGYSICGFLLGYLLTRLYLAAALERADSSLRKIDQAVERIGAAAAAGTRDPASDPVSLAEESAAREVGRLALTADSQALRNQVADLAREYEAIRAAYPGGDRRTRLMEVVASKMRALSYACYALLPDLARSTSEGERLAAVSFLEVKPSEEYLTWLADRIEREKPFISYHAAWALRHAARKLPVSALDRVEQEIRRGFAHLESTGQTATDREDTLRAALADLDERRRRA